MRDFFYSIYEWLHSAWNFSIAALMGKLIWDNTPSLKYSNLMSGFKKVLYYFKVGFGFLILLLYVLGIIKPSQSTQKLLVGYLVLLTVAAGLYLYMKNKEQEAKKLTT